ncbi:unnamed protein product [Bursaphelenchus xylophilus]|uniref:(pine wood nematode) hypothetical protein n=1 Tax=Bursaphelenchus xylophilus TaxID=6326 RepID=A0A1I7S323_BURXY|nr:unnamed protein product [Bursaphelenchus xylophilus]CAG9116070.1 unnamed protein product [Bursaphelenchus xylophilus]
MNMVKLRQILELRRATKAPPLVPPKNKRGSDSDYRRGPKEIIDVHISARHFRCLSKYTSANIVLIFSESDDARKGPWRVTTASEIIPKAECFDLSSVFAVEFQFERCQYIKVDICEWEESNAVSLGYAIFTVAELVVKYGIGIEKEIIEDESGQKIADISISCTLRPKPHSVLLQFCARGVSKKSLALGASQMFFEVKKVESRTGSVVLYRSETVKYGNKCIFKTFSLQSSDVNDSILEVTCYQKDVKNAKIFIGSCETTYERLRIGPTLSNVYALSYENSKGQKKVCGEFELLKFNEMVLPSFLEFITTGTLINVAFAIDFTQNEFQVDPQNVQQYLDDVELAIKAIGEPLREFNISSAYAAFGFGAKVPPHFRESQEFCLNLDTDPYCRGLDGVLDSFKTAFANTQPINMAHLSHVIYYVSKLAQNAVARCKAGQTQYHILVLITRGIFDDIKETVQALIFASRAPISVVFVGIGELDLSELERLGTAGTRLNYHGRKPERDCMQFVSVPKCREEESTKPELLGLIAERGLVSVPYQMTSWMSRNGIKPPVPDPCSSRHSARGSTVFRPTFPSLHSMQANVVGISSVDMNSCATRSLQSNEMLTDEDSLRSSLCERDSSSFKESRSSRKLPSLDQCRSHSVNESGHR